MEDSDGTLSSVAQCIEKLRRGSSTSQEKEKYLNQLRDLIDTNANAFSAVGSHSQAVPMLVSLLRSGSSTIKVQAATVLGILCKEDELRVKVLLGGCIPQLLALLKSASFESQLAAAKTIYAVSLDGARDHVGSKFFTTEGVVPVLWEKLQKGLQDGTMIDNLLTGSLRNLSNSTEGFWLATAEFGGVNILIKLLLTGQSNTLANVCSLLARLMMEDVSVCSSVLAATATKQFLKLLGPDNEASIRAEAAGALKSLSAQCKEARREIASCNGIPVLINATIAPSKEFMQGEHGQALQENAMCALANISGGLSYVISSLAESLESCTSPVQISDTLGALASALMIYNSKAESSRASDPLAIEQILIKQFKPKFPVIIQERIIEALATLYGNAILSNYLVSSDAKRLLAGLITMANNEVREELIRSLLLLCNNNNSLWHALEGRDGVQLLISLLGLSSEQQQESAVALLSLLSKENDECKWAITAAGGIPPLVQILETGSPKAKEDSATILGNLCNHSEDIRECVQSADAVPSLLWLLKNGSDNGKQIAAKTLNHFIHKSDTGTISQLSALLTSDQPESKVYVLDALGSLLSVSSLNDMLCKGKAANDAIETMIKILSSAKEETRAKSASVLAGLFHFRNDLRETNIAVKALFATMKLLKGGSDKILIESMRCHAAIFLSIEKNKEVADVGNDALIPLVQHLHSSVLEVTEQATRALANLFLDKKITLQVYSEAIILPFTRVLQDGEIDARTHASSAIARLIRSCSVDDVLFETINRSGTVLALVSHLDSAGIESSASTEGIDALLLLSRLKQTIGNAKPPWTILAEYPHTIIPLVSFVANGTDILQDKTIEILSRLCYDQSVVLGNAISETVGCISSIAQRVINTNLMKVKIGGAALLICAAKQNPKIFEIFNDSNTFSLLIHSLVEMISSMNNLIDHKDITYVEDIRIYRSHLEKNRHGEHEYITSVISGCALPIWLLSVLASHDDNSKDVIMNAGAIEVLTFKISQHIILETQVVGFIIFFFLAFIKIYLFTSLFC